MTIRLAMGHVESFDDRVAAFAHQLGVPRIQFHTPSDLDGGLGYWDLDQLGELRDRCTAAGLTIEGIENVPYANWNHVLTGGPDRAAQLNNYCRTIRHLGAVGIPTLGHHFMPTYVWRTDLRARGPGGALVTAFDADLAHRGNALAAYKLTPPGTDHVDLDEERMWDNYRVFLEAVLPVAEDSGVRLALHPDDPPVSTALGGAARIFASVEGLERAHELAGGSPAWGLDLCLGTISELDGERAINRIVDHFGPLGAICYVHCRDVRGVVPKFHETRLGDGNFDPAAVLRRLHDRGFNGFVIDDHVPAFVGDPDTWGDTSAEAYTSRGRAHAIGYLQGVLNALGLDAA